MNEEKIPWYREPYVWLLIAFPLAAVVGGFITLGLAIASNDGLVVDDYYREGLRINRVLERDRAAADLGLKAELELSGDNDGFKLFLSGNRNFNAPQKLQVNFLHSTRSGFDRHVLITKQKGNMYAAGIPPLVRGHWYVQIETNDWRLLKSVIIK